MINPFKRKSPERRREEIREKAASRLATVLTADILPLLEGQLGETWRAFDQFQDHPEPATLEEYSRCVAILQGSVDVLQKRFAQT